jgi:hypothetical protein
MCALPACVPCLPHPADATIVQASFTASQPLSAVQQLVSQLALEPVAPALYLYTTPPKTVLKDPTATLYQLKLVPAAHLYVGCEHKRLKAPAAAAVAGGVLSVPFTVLFQNASCCPRSWWLSAPCCVCNCAMRKLGLLQCLDSPHVLGAALLNRCLLPLLLHAHRLQETATQGLS